MDEAQRLFLSARINMYRLLVPKVDGERTPLAAEQYGLLKNAMQSFSQGQGSHGYSIAEHTLATLGLDVEAWKAVAPPSSTGELRLGDYYHVTELDNVMDHLQNNNQTALQALKEASDKLEAKSAAKSA